jgi:hypothetical protein
MAMCAAIAQGLRKAALTRAAHAGCTGPMALSGHSTLSQVQIYIDEADQERQADAALAKVAKARTTNLGPSTYKPEQRSP